MRAMGVVAVVTACAAGAGCVSLKHTEEARFFVLRSVAQPQPQPVADGARALVGVQPVRLPGHLERPQIVTWVGPGELRIDEFVRWGEPLDEGFTRTLAENLALLLPEHRVVRAPWRAAATPSVRVVTEVRVFGPQPDGRVLLDGRWGLLGGRDEQPLARGRSSHERGPLAGTAGGGPGAEVEAMSELVAELAREIATALRALEEPQQQSPGQ